MRRIYLLVISTFFLTMGHAVAQVYSNKVVGEKHSELRDSLKSYEYPYSLPIWGKKATEKGFDLPYSAGLSVQYLWQKSDLTINNLEIGFNNGPMTNLDEVIRFNDAQAETNGLNFRPDVWILPFLNVYGILAVSHSTTTVDFSINVPDTNGGSREIFQTETQAEFDGTSAGFGITPTMGVGGGWLALDMNFTWTDIEALEKPAFAFVFGPRMGKTFKFKDQKNIAIWGGAFRVKINTGTSGSLNMSDLFDTQGLEQRIETGMGKVEQASEDVNTWWNNLTPVEQQNPINKAKYETAVRAIDAAGRVLTGASGAVTDINNSTVQYSLDKKQKQMWNFIVGSQYQFNKHWMLRAEFGFLGSRSQFIGGLQYRFGI